MSKSQAAKITAMLLAASAADAARYAINKVFRNGFLMRRYVPYWIMKRIAHKINLRTYYYYSRMFYSPEGKVCWIGGMVPSSDSIPAPTIGLLLGARKLLFSKEDIELKCTNSKLDSLKRKE